MQRECYRCDFWNSDFECCVLPPYEEWYACPIEAKKPESQRELEEYAEWLEKERNNGRV